MTEAMLEVVRAGLHTTLQDDGRLGYQHLGVPVGGALDRDAMRRANALVGNAPGEAVLEVTLTACVLRVSVETMAAITGARFTATIDGNPIPMDCAVQWPAGAILDLGTRRSGARACVAVRGGFDVPVVLGSRGAWPLDARHGALVDGQLLRLAQRAIAPARSSVLPGLARRPIVRVLPALETTPRALAELTSTGYRVAASANRMAMPLDGPTVTLPGAARASSGTVAGAIQIPPDGRPVLLLNDRQTTGGYPVAAVLITADLPHVAQCAPGDELRFVACTRQEALEALWRAEAHWGRP